MLAFASRHPSQQHQATSEIFVPPAESTGRSWPRFLQRFAKITGKTPMRPISHYQIAYFFPDHSKGAPGKHEAKPSRVSLLQLECFIKALPGLRACLKARQSLTRADKTSCIASILTISISLQPLPGVSVAWQRCNNDGIRVQLLRRVSTGKLQPAALNSGLCFLSYSASSDDLSSSRCGHVSYHTFTFAASVASCPAVFFFFFSITPRSKSCCI